jgi:copper chaperone NosL
VAIFLGVSVVGLADFWKWEYDYGHNLDEETAIIKIPGMSYQPPLIGSRQILNFTAHSWPGSGGWIAIGAALTALGVAAGEFRRGRRAGGGTGAVASLPVVALLAVGLSGCGEPEPRDLAYGIDSCEHCHMGLADDRHGAEVLTPTGKAYVFDSVECLAAWLDSQETPPEVHSLWVTDFAAPGSLVPVEDALFLASPTLPSPMGLGLTAFRRAADRDGAVTAFGGEALDWEGVRTFVSSRWPDGTPAPGGHAHMAQGA